FLATRVQGKVQFIELDWSVARFLSAFTKLQGTEAAIKQMGVEISRIDTNIARLAAALAARMQPIPMLAGLGSLGQALPHPQAGRTPATSSAKSEAEPQNDPEPQA